MTTPRIRVSREWLALREAADAAARAKDLVERLTRQLPATGPRVIHDLGCGTGAMARWLAPVLPGPQHWILHDLDADLLDVAPSTITRWAKQGCPHDRPAKGKESCRFDEAEVSVWMKGKQKTGKIGRPTAQGGEDIKAHLVRLACCYCFREA